MAVKLQESVRCNQIASAALEMVQDGGFESITCRDVAIKCGCSYNTVVRLFKNRRNLSIAVIDQAEFCGDEHTAKIGRRLFDCD